MDRKGPFWVFSDWNLKKLMSYLPSAPSSLSKYQKSSKTTANGTKKWNQKMEPKMVYLGISAAKFEKLLLYLKSASSNLPKCKKLFKTKKKQIWNQKCLIWAFWAVSSKSYCHTWSQHPRHCQNAKFRTKIKIQNKAKTRKRYTNADLISSSSYGNNMLKISH